MTIVLCTFISIIHFRFAAQWGLTGEQNEAITRNVVCCDEPEGFGPEVDGEIPQAVVLNAAEQTILNTMHPVWFGRHDGYHGVYHSFHSAVKLIITHIEKIFPFHPPKTFIRRNYARGGRTLLQNHRRYAPMSRRGL